MIKDFFSKRKLNIIFSLCAIIFMLLVWVVTYYSVKNEYIVPSLGASIKSLFVLITGKAFWLAFFNTFARTVIAFIVSFALAAVLAVLSVISKAFAAFIKPVMVFLRTLPTLAVILILLIWTTPKVAPVVVTVLVIFPMVYAQITAAIGGIDEGLIEMAEVYRINKRDRLLKIYLPLITPNILSQTGSDMSLGIKIMISAEVLASTYSSMGGLMQNARLYVDMPRLAALTIASVILGLIIDVAFSQLERITYRWNRKEGRRD